MENELNPRGQGQDPTKNMNPIDHQWDTMINLELNCGSSMVCYYVIQYVVDSFKASIDFPL